MANCDVQTLLNNAACFACLPPGTLSVVELQLLCEILNSTPAGGSAVVGSTNQTLTFPFADFIPYSYTSTATGLYLVNTLFEVASQFFGPTGQIDMILGYNDGLLAQSVVLGFLGPGSPTPGALQTASSLIYLPAGNTVTLTTQQNTPIASGAMRLAAGVQRLF